MVGKLRQRSGPLRAAPERSDGLLSAAAGERNQRAELLLHQQVGKELRVRCRLIDSFKTNSYNNVPPVIMELMKDMKGFSDIIGKIVLVFSASHA